MHPKIRNIVFAGLAAIIVASPAQAGFFSITVTESGGATVVIDDDDGLFDINPLPGAITVDTDALNAELVEFQFASLGGTSNAESGTPFSNDSASLTQTGEVSRIGTTGDATVTIVATDNDYFFPAFNPKVMNSGATDLFSFTAAGDDRTFQSFFDPANTPGGMTIPSPLQTFMAGAGVGPFNTGGNTSTPLGDQLLPFALTNETVISLGAAGTFASNPRDQFSGATNVIGIPEPSAAILAALGLPMLVVYGLRRRRAMTIA
jgi:hypothetical protein